MMLNFYCNENFSIIRSRQYYSFVTDPECKRLGSQCWVYGAVMLTESLLCIKNGKELFGRTQAVNIIVWVLFMLLMSVLCVTGFWYLNVSISVSIYVCTYVYI